MPKAPSTAIDSDGRLYVLDPEGWSAHVKEGWEKQYCFSKRPGEDFFHLLTYGEVYLQRGEEIVCLMCAARRRIITTDRLFWQQPGRTRPAGEPGI